MSRSEVTLFGVDIDGIILLPLPILYVTTFVMVKQGRVKASLAEETAPRLSLGRRARLLVSYSEEDSCSFLLPQ